VRAAIHLQYRTSIEHGVRQEQNRIDYFFDFPNPADRVQPLERFIGFRS
jgi:hypothetical protein